MDGERKEEIIRRKKRKLHELPNTEMVKSLTIRLASGHIVIGTFMELN